jgi:AcrR family transcriptional regulator
MPRISDELWQKRRRHVLTSAWSCFSKEGFHATSMDQVIAATGMSSSAVYRYFRSKDELIDATVDEALGLSEELFGRLLDDDPVPGPGEILRVLVGTVHHRAQNTDYDLSRLAMQAWTEALRRPHLRERTRTYYVTVRRHLEELARRWRDAGHIAADADPADVAQLVVTLMPGLIVMEEILGETSEDRLLAGLAALGTPVTTG